MLDTSRFRLGFLHCHFSLALSNLKQYSCGDWTLLQVGCGKSELLADSVRFSAMDVSTEQKVVDKSTSPAISDGDRHNTESVRIRKSAQISQIKSDSEVRKSLTEGDKNTDGNGWFL